MPPSGVSATEGGAMLKLGSGYLSLYDGLETATRKGAAATV